MTASRLPLTLNVNGETHDIIVPAHATLLEALRDSVGLTGSKRGCNHGVCGACTVLLEGRVARACLTLAADVGERPVTTVEGLATDGKLSGLQRALVEAGAIQCGYCTPGFVVALTELLQRDPGPTRDRIREALAGNLCRCSGYVKIVAAAESLAGDRA